MQIIEDGYYLVKMSISKKRREDDSPRLLGFSGSKTLTMEGPIVAQDLRLPRKEILGRNKSTHGKMLTHLEPRDNISEMFIFWD